MITEEQYSEAKETIRRYEEQLNISRVIYKTLDLNKGNTGMYLLSVTTRPQTIHITLGKEYLILDKDVRGRLRIELNNGKKKWIYPDNSKNNWAVKL